MKAESDVQSQKSNKYSHLDWVGMTQIQTSVLLLADQKPLAVPAFLDLGVDLSENNRGIHMSRLYKLHQEYILNHLISKKNISEFAKKSIESQEGLSHFFSMRLKLSWPKKTISLQSHLAGFRNYPIEIIFENDQSRENIWLQFEVLYSSTCPQSAALSMEVLNNQTRVIDRLPATPHAQRSRAVVKLILNDLNQELIEQLINLVELSLGTPVQTTVKKADEMKFAELNAENLMFCEDAARKISQALKQASEVIGFQIYCEHQESLHPHNASSMTQNQYKAPQKIHFS